MVERVLAVIPTFRPPTSLGELADELANSVDHVVISDDASPCTYDALLQDIADRTSLSLIRHDRNRGIARGLNDGLRIAHSAHVNWLLTVDQDSAITPGYVISLVTDATSRVSRGERVGAIGAEEIFDAAGKLSYPLYNGTYGPVTDELIQTGTLWSVEALVSVGGFDESLGIDAVDAAACLRLREAGFSICVSMGTSVGHTIGSAQMVRLFGREILVTGHSPERRSSMLRNRLRLFPAEFRQSPRHAVRTLRRVTVNQTLGLLLEGDRWAKAKGSIRGLGQGKTR